MDKVNLKKGYKMKYLFILLTICFINNALAEKELKSFREEIAKIMVDKEGKKITSSKITKAKYIAVYYSASWCGPCLKFTPKLTKFYSDNKSKGVEVVLLSFDKTQKKQNQYLGHMNFPGIDFSKRETSGLFEYCGNGVPCLTVFDASGKVIVDGRTMNADQVLTKLGKLIK